MMYCFAKFCRLCLEKSDSLLDYQTKDADNISLINKINTLMPSLIISNENYSTLICDKCQIQLNNSYKFFNNCFKTKERLFKYNLQLNVNGDKVKRELNGILDKLEGAPYNLSDIIKDEGYVVNIKNEEGFVKINDDEGQRKKNVLEILEIKDPEIHVVLIKTEKNEADESLTLNSKDEEDPLHQEHTNFDRIIITEKNKCVCKTCGKSFCNNANLKRHTRNVHLKKRHECQGCDKTFTDEQSLNYHYRVVHLNIRNHKCEYCGRRFPKLCGLKYHLKKCQNRKEIVPEEDDGLVNQETSNLVLNTKKIIKVCKLCGKSFSNKNLQRHIRSVHMKIRHDCQICHKTFTDVNGLNYHKRVVHLNIRKHKCEYCGYQFPEPRHLRYHLKICKYRREIILNEDEGSRLSVIKIRTCASENQNPDIPKHEEVDKIELKTEEVDIE